MKSRRLAGEGVLQEEEEEEEEVVMVVVAVEEEDWVAEAEAFGCAERENFESRVGGGAFEEEELPVRDAPELEASAVPFGVVLSLSVLSGGTISSFCSGYGAL